MGLPGAVKRQGDAANKIIAEGVQVRIDDGSGDTDIDTDITSDTADTVDDGGGKGHDYEQMYKVMKGKYDAEVPRLATQVRELAEQVNTSNATVNNLNEIISRGIGGGGAQQGGDDGKPLAAGKSAAAGAINRADYEGYGEEMLILVDTVNALKEENAALKAKQGDVEVRVASVGKVVQKDANQRFFDNLTALVPSWRSINKDEHWLVWLNQDDPVSGIRRQDILDGHHSRGDFQKMARLFNAFISESGWKPAKRGGRSLNSEIEPELGGGGPVGDGESKLVSRKQYQKATRDYIDKKITQQQFDKITKDFQRSIKEGKA